MKHTMFSPIVCLATVLLCACASDTPPSQAAQQPAADAAAPMSGHGAPMQGGGTMPAAGAGTVSGKVVETMDVGTYTYVQVDDGSKKIWAAAPKFAVAVGDQVVVPQGMPMQKFESKTLGRTFDVIYFADRIQVAGKAAAGQPASPEQLSAAHGGSSAAPRADLDFSGLKKADGGHTVAELFAGKGGLAGKDVTVRGKVAKFTADIMGKNWLHLQDGTGSAGTNDLTVTTGVTASVGDTVLVRGKLGTDKDFGFGYKYELIIEDASVTAE